MLMSAVKVGDQIDFCGHYATVTELTDNGFKYEYNVPFCLHPFLGFVTNGEHFGADGVVADADYFRAANLDLKARLANEHVGVKRDE